MLVNSSELDEYFILTEHNMSVVRGHDPEVLNEQLQRLNDQQMKYQLPAIVYTALLMLLGAPGNLLVFYVYFFKWQRTASRVFILFLAGLDCINCVSTLPIEIYLMRFPFMMDMPVVCKISRFSTYLMNASSAAILVAIAVDRYKRICRPYESNFSESTCKYICLGCIGIAFGITWPAFFLYGTRRFEIEEGVVAKACLVQNNYDNTPYPLAYFVLHGGSTLVIFSILSVLYYFVGLQIYRRRSFKMRRCTRVQVIVEEKTTDNKSPNHSVEVKQNGDNLELMKNDKEEDGNENEDNDIVSEKQPEEEQTNGVESNDICNNKRKVKKANKHQNKKRDSRKNKKVGKSNSLKVEMSSCFESSRESSFNSKHETGSLRKTRLRHVLLRGDSSSDAQGNTHVKCTNFRVGKSTLMLFLITIAYIISFLPFYIIVIMRQSDKHLFKNMNVSGYMTCQLFLRSYLLSSAINPIIYSFCNDRFRAFCMQLFCRSKRAQARNTI